MEGKSLVKSAVLTSKAFNKGFFGSYGEFIVSIGLLLLAFSTMITWSYYGDSSAKYLLGDKAVVPYRVLFILAIPIGAIIKLELVWKLSDIANALMAVPNLIGVIFLSGVVAKMSKDHFSNKDNFKNNK